MINLEVKIAGYFGKSALVNFLLTRKEFCKVMIWWVVPSGTRWYGSQLNAQTPDRSPDIGICFTHTLYGAVIKRWGTGISPGYIHGKVQSENTVKPLITDTSIIRTPLYYGQFHWFQKCQKSDIPYLYNRYTSVKRTILVLSLWCPY